MSTPPTLLMGYGTHLHSPSLTLFAGLKSVDRTAERRRIATAMIPHTAKQEAKQTLSSRHWRAGALARSLARRNIPTLIDATCPARPRPPPASSSPTADGIPRTALVIVRPWTRGPPLTVADPVGHTAARSADADELTSSRVQGFVEVDCAILRYDTIRYEMLF